MNLQKANSQTFKCCENALKNTYYIVFPTCKTLQSINGSSMQQHFPHCQIYINSVPWMHLMPHKLLYNSIENSKNLKPLQEVEQVKTQVVTFHTETTKSGPD